MEMNPPTLSISDIFKTAWSKVYGSKSTFFLIILSTLVLQIISQGFNYLFTHLTAPGILLISSLVILFLIINFIIFILYVGNRYLGVQRALDNPIYFGMIKPLFKPLLFIKLLGALLLWLLIIILPVIIAGIIEGLLFKSNGNFLSIIGGLISVYFMLRLCLTLVSVAVKEIGPVAAIITSWHATKLHTFKLLLIYICSLIIIAVTTLITLGIALIWTAPWIAIVWGEVYKTLIVAREQS